MGGCRVWRLHGADQEGAVARVFGERMRAGLFWWVLERCGGMWGSIVSEFAAGCCWTVGGLVVEWKVAALVRGGGVCFSCGGAWEVRDRMRV